MEHEKHILDAGGHVLCRPQEQVAESVALLYSTQPLLPCLSESPTLDCGAHSLCKFQQTESRRADSIALLYQFIDCSFKGKLSSL